MPKAAFLSSKCICGFAMLLAFRWAGAQKPPPPSPQPPVPPSDLDWNPDTRIPEGMRADSKRYMFRVSVDRERLAGPENVTKPMNIAAFESMLAANREKSDEKLAELVAAVRLTERVNRARRERWQKAYTGSLTRGALLAVGDASSFLELPADDRLNLPTPPLPEQRRMIHLVGGYLGQLLAKLPDFLATRRTTYFEDWPSHVDWPALAAGPTGPDDPARWLNRPLYKADAMKIPVKYVDGQEIQEKRGFANPYAGRLTTVGEFGPILLAVLRDAARSNLAWSGWEQSEDGPLAVFRFDVPKEKSHYAVNMPTAKQQQVAAYRGEMAVRLGDGAILRLSVIASMERDADVQAANIQVEYGSVEIGGKQYLCPVHAVDLSKVPIARVRAKGQNTTAPLQTQVNDVSFEGYRVFRSDSRITSVEKPK